MGATLWPPSRRVDSVISARGVLGRDHRGKEAQAQHPDRPDRRSPVRRTGDLRPSLHEDAEHRPHRPRRSDVHLGVPHHAAVLAQPRLDPDRPVREPARHHRQRGARRPQPSPAQLPCHPAAPGLRDRPHRQVAHGQFGRATAGLRQVGELSRPRLDHRPDPEHRRRREEVRRLHHRSAERPCRRFPAPEARQAVRALLRPQGRPSRRLPGRRRHHRFHQRRLSPRAAPCRSLQGRAFPAPAQCPAGRRGGQGQAGVDGGACAAHQRCLAQTARRHPGRHRRGDPPACRHDGVGRRRHGRRVQGAGRDRRARQHLHSLPGRQRLLLRRTRSGAGTALCL